MRSRLAAAMAARGHLLSGLLDSGLASAATFIVGVYAVRELAPEVLGAYALAFSAVFLAGILPAHLIFTPAEVAVVAHPPSERLRYLPRTVLLGSTPALIGGLIAPAWVLLVPGDVPRTAIVALMVPAAVTAAVSPVQDHVRRMLHSAGASSLAARVSAVQILVVVTALVIGAWAGIPEPWIPFGALALANVGSVSAGLVMAIRLGVDGEVEELSFRKLARAGAWILASGALSPAAGFVAAGLLANLASAATLGYAEAARVVGQPVRVLAVGLSSALMPHSMAAARSADRLAARKVSRQFNVLILLTGLVSVAVLGFAWKGNPFFWLMPSAYVITGLVFVTIVTQVIVGIGFPLRSEVLGASREAPLVGVELAGSGGRVAVAAAAGILQAFALPLGLALQGTVRAVGCWLLLRGVYTRSNESVATLGEPKNREP